MALWGLLQRVMPLRFTAAVELRRGVERILADRPPLPDAFYEDIVNHVVSSGEHLRLTGNDLKTATMSVLARDMIIIVALIDGERHPDLPTDGYQAQLLRKHGILPNVT